MSNESSTVVPLSTATQLGVVVAGTNFASKYVCVAYGLEAAMAIRITKNDRVSVRIEKRPECESHSIQERALAMGLSKQDAGHYSTHAMADSRLAATMSAAAFVAAFEWLFNDPVVMPNKALEGIGE